MAWICLERTVFQSGGGQAGRPGPQRAVPRGMERVLQYLGLSMDADQVVNSSLDDDDCIRRMLLPNCAHNAWHWFDLHRKHTKSSMDMTY
jgi:hypothetical protein